MAGTRISELEALVESGSVSPVDPVERVDALTQLAWELRATDVPRAHALATEARQLACKHEYKLGQARAARTMAMTIHDTAGLRTMFQLAEEAKQLFDEANDGPGRAASRDYLASLHEFLGNLAGGLELALDALSIARGLGDPIRQGYALSSIGGILAASGEVDAAVERLKEALQFFEGAQDFVGVGTICSRLCKLLKSAGRNEEALTYAEMCRAAAEVTPGAWASTVAALSVMAEVEDEQGNEKEAERLYRIALGLIPPGAGGKVMRAEPQVALGRMLLKHGALAEAEVELSGALLGIEGDSVSIVAEVATHEALADLRESQGELSETIGHLRKAQTLRERISQQDARNKLAQIEVRAAMEGAQKDAETQKSRFVELHNTQSKLVESERMALLGKLAAGTAHELHTPLGVLLSNTKLCSTATQRLISSLKKEGELGTQAAKLASVLESCQQSSDEAVERIAAIAHSFKQFSQLDKAAQRSFDVREGLDSALAVLEPTVSEVVKFERHFQQVPAIQGWPRELNHAFMTVLQNAAQAIDGAGVVSVGTRATQEHVLVEIADSGRGMNQEQAARLFDVTWSQEGTRTSMRLGLSAAYTTMQKHGGTMNVQSALGHGTTIAFRFPIT